MNRLSITALFLILGLALLPAQEPTNEPAQPATTPAPAETTTPPTQGDPAKPDTPPADPKPDPDPAPEPTDPQPEPEPEPETEPEPEPVEPEPTPTDTGYAQIERLANAIEIIRQNYVDADKVTYDRLVNSALQGMLADLDPHSQYIHPEVFAQFKSEQSNTYDGVGITIGLREGDLTIISVREDGPAATAGILPSDVIIKIGEALAADIGLAECIQLLQGNPGEPLQLTVRRPATTEVFEFELVRQVIQFDTVKDPLILHEDMTGDLKIGYVRLLQFNQPSADELEDAIDRLEDQGMQALVFDLRNNPGGLLHTAIEILGLFVPEDTLVLTTEGRVESQNPPPYKTPSRKRRPRDYPMAILINHGSASASEVVSGALQDLKRAVIVGQTSFGKGSVQSIVPLPGGAGAALRLTTAKYYTPSHRTIHEHGVTPNIVATLTPKQEKELFRWWRDNALADAKAKDLRDLDDTQLQRAVDILKGLHAYRSK